MKYSELSRSAGFPSVRYSSTVTAIFFGLMLSMSAHADSRSDKAYKSMMASERASTQAIRDSMRFVNKAQADTSSHWSQPIVDAMQKVSPAQKDANERAIAARYQSLQNQQKVQMLKDLAGNDYVPAMAELGEAYLNGDLGLSSDAQAALAYLLPAAQAGDATSAYNAGLAHVRLNQGVNARPYFEQAAKAGVRGAAYKAALEALFSSDWEAAVLYGKQAATDNSAMGAYIVCLSAQALSPETARYENVLTAEYCPLAYDLGYLDGAEDAGNGLANHGEWARAYQYYLRCVERSGTSYCQRAAGISAVKTEQYAEAELLLTKAIAAGVNDEYAEILLARLAITFENKQWDKAEQMAKAVLTHQGSYSAEAHFILAWVYDNRPDKKYAPEVIFEHLYTAARGGNVDAQEMLRSVGKTW